MKKGDYVLVTESIDGGNFAEFSKTEISEWLDQREKFSFKADKSLTGRLKSTLEQENIPYHEGKILSISGRAVFTPGLIEELNKRGYVGVEMETATLFACAQYTDKKAASLQVVSDMFGEPFDYDVAGRMWMPALELAIDSMKSASLISNHELDIEKEATKRFKRVCD